MKVNRQTRSAPMSKAAKILGKSPGITVRPAQTKAIPRPLSVPKIRKAIQGRQD